MLFVIIVNSPASKYVHLSDMEKVAQIFSTHPHCMMARPYLQDGRCKIDEPGRDHGRQPGRDEVCQQL